MKPLRTVLALLAFPLLPLCASGCANDPSIEGDVLGCGAVLARIDHQVLVQSNGALRGTGDACEDPNASSEAVVYGPKYQCVELASRYFMVRFHVDRPFDADAIDLCHKAEHGELARQVSVKRNTGEPSASTYVPVHGDLMVFSRAPFGHVGVVDLVDGNLVDIYEQNGSPTGRATHALGTEECFIHAYANHEPPQP